MPRRLVVRGTTQLFVQILYHGTETLVGYLAIGAGAEAVLEPAVDDHEGQWRGQVGRGLFAPGESRVYNEAVATSALRPVARAPPQEGDDAW